MRDLPAVAALGLCVVFAGAAAHPGDDAAARRIIGFSLDAAGVRTAGR
ncbi:hypothetical protein [Mesorhizobium sp. B2-8-3]|nr:hypothetical protein [Mesorhizobium sp. B2-8-3]